MSNVQDDITQRVADGFYQTETATKAEGWPEDSNNWTHLLATTHSNVANYYSLQIAGGFFDNDHFFVRKAQAPDLTKPATQPWRELWHSGNLKYTSVANYGAKDGPYDGTYDKPAANAYAFQIAYNEAPAGSRIVIPPGQWTYNTSQLFGTKTVLWETHGATDTATDPGALLELPGIHWGIYQDRILAAKKQRHLEGTPVIEFRADCGPGVVNGKDAFGNPSGNGISNTVTVNGYVKPDTKHGHFALNVLVENESVYNEGTDVFFGHVAVGAYGRQRNIQNAPMWAFCGEVREYHESADPIYASLGAELSVVAHGTDAHRQRTMLYLPTNKMIDDTTLTEFGMGVFWKTAPHTIYKDAMLLEGDYEYVLRVHDDRLNADPTKRQQFHARSLIKVDGGEFSQPIIDLGSAYSAGNDCALQVSANHHIRWSTVDGQIAQKLGRLGDTMSIDGLPWSGTAGAQVGYVTIVLNGTRLKVPCHLEN
ncbi:hypothetical protein [Methylobacterium indicum]|uniref:Uncharacterized protein n=1 Tax=Methylobacterium indicum TaxID=1775910 RepID=A0A8H8X1C4_9HYPH|nr:hypothetical protein [Methylobacterium indicum]BCM87747.1 hypothetical protein mvi_62080 [Methylobacterium indicum]